MSSVFDRVGGEAAVAAAVDQFYERVLSDQRLASFFQGIDTGLLMAKQRDFLSFAFGGPVEWNGPTLREAHRNAVEQGMSDAHFGWVAEHLVDTLESLSVDKDLIEEIVVIVSSVKDDVLGR